MPIMQRSTVCGPMAQDEGDRLRQFCLDVIEEAFGYRYRPDWHGDLDRLGGPDDEYQLSRGGAFFVVKHGDDVVGCGGLRPLSARSDLVDRFVDRYPRPGRVGSIWRVYVRPDQRGHGIGKWVVDELEGAARALRYTNAYLHTSATNPRSIAFWERQGYASFDRDEAVSDAVHMDKPLF